MTLFERLRETVATTLDIRPDVIHENTTNSDIAAWDSLGQVTLMMAIEQTFGIQLDVEDFARLTSIRAILDHLRRENVE